MDLPREAVEARKIKISHAGHAGNAAPPALRFLCPAAMESHMFARRTIGISGPASA
jgi:hypothetical protein